MCRSVKKKIPLSEKMSFEELPDEILIEQMLLLTPQDVVNACQVDRQFARVCQRPNLWIRLIRRDFPEVDLRDVDDPRRFYVYNINQIDAVRGLWTALNDPGNIRQLASYFPYNSGNYAIRFDSPFVPYSTMFTPTYPALPGIISIGNGAWFSFVGVIALDPVLGPVFLRMLHRTIPELAKYLENLRQEIILSRELNERTMKIREQGRLIFQYQRSDGTVQSIDVPDTIVYDCEEDLMSYLIQMDLKL